MGGSRASVTSKMKRFVIIVNGWKPLTIITKHSILDVTAALDPPLVIIPLLPDPDTFVEELKRYHLLNPLKVRSFMDSK